MKRTGNVRRVNRLIMTLLVLMLLALAALPALAEQLNGGGEWASLSGDSIKGTWSVSLTRDGDRVTGTLALTGSDVFRDAAVTGTIDRSSIMLGVMSQADQRATFSGKLDGNSVSGEWESDAVNDHGVWTGTLATAKLH